MWVVWFGGPDCTIEANSLYQAQVVGGMQVTINSWSHVPPKSYVNARVLVYLVFETWQDSGMNRMACEVLCECGQRMAWARLIRPTE
jgi:hypothetical protein